MMDVLEKLFGSAAKVKIMRLFLFNPEEPYDIKQVIDRAKISPFQARREITVLEKIGLVKKRSFFRDFVVGRKKSVVRRRASGWMLNQEFEYLQPLQLLLAHVGPERNREIIKRLSRIGKLRLVILSGFFIQNFDARVDLFIVADTVRRGTLDNVIKVLESETGREIRYASFETPDFRYRLGVYDKLIRDVLDFDHETILDRLSLPDVK